MPSGPRPIGNRSTRRALPIKSKPSPGVEHVIVRWGGPSRRSVLQPCYRHAAVAHRGQYVELMCDCVDAWPRNCLYDCHQPQTIGALRGQLTLARGERMVGARNRARRVLNQCRAARFIMPQYPSTGWLSISPSNGSSHSSRATAAVSNALAPWLALSWRGRSLNTPRSSSHSLR